jgi:hypothetical protein
VTDPEPVAGEDQVISITPGFAVAEIFCGAVIVVTPAWAGEMNGITDSKGTISETTTTL